MGAIPSWCCGADHQEVVICGYCGYSPMDERIYFDEKYQQIPLNKEVMNGQIWTDEGRVNLRVSVFWLDKPNPLKDEK